MPSMLPQVKGVELLLKWANEAGHSKGVTFEHGCAPPGPAFQGETGDRWGIEASDLQNVMVCRWVGSLPMTQDVPSPFSLSWDSPPWTEEQKTTFISNVSAAIDNLLNKGM